MHAGWGQDGHFQSLQTLNVSRNQLTGQLPAQWGVGVGQSGINGMASLNTLDAHFNQLAGPLPAAWASQNLTFNYIDLSSNVLTGAGVACMLASGSVHCADCSADQACCVCSVSSNVDSSAACN